MKKNRKWTNEIFSLDNTAMHGYQGKIISVKNRRDHLVKRLLAKRFFLGIRRLAGNRVLFDGRLFFLTGDFCSRSAEENTRRALNHEPLQKNGLGDLHDSSLGDTYSFLVITDPHIKEDNTRNFAAIHNILLPSDAFLVVNGDLTQAGTLAQIELFVLLVNKLPLPVYPVIGNHDIYFHAWPVWQKLVGNTVYRIDSGDTTLIMLDSANGRLGQQQIFWLEQQLQCTNKHTFVFSHCNFFIPRFTTFQQFAALWEKPQVLTQLQHRVDAVFTGHSHKRHIHVALNVPYINIDDFRHKSSFCRVYVSPAGIRYEYGSIPLDNKT